MKRVTLLFAAAVMGLSACRKDSPARKVLEGAPVAASEDIRPVAYIQAHHLMQHGVLTVIIPIIKRLGIPEVSYSELSGTGPVYQFSAGDSHYGLATATITFRDAGNSIIDPINSAPSSTTTVRWVDVGLTGSHSQFSYSGSFQIYLDIAGDPNSGLLLRGHSSFSGNGYTVGFEAPISGMIPGPNGLVGGELNVTGTGPGGAISGILRYASSREANGPLNWDGRTGQLHIQDNGDTVLVTDNTRLFFN
jgi:hypothetical protein